jgi:hypothetical protein
MRVTSRRADFVPRRVITRFDNNSSRFCALHWRNLQATASQIVIPPRSHKIARTMPASANTTLNLQSLRTSAKIYHGVM